VVTVSYFAGPERETLPVTMDLTRQALAAVGGRSNPLDVLR
jgi:hypothetical protein